MGLGRVTVNLTQSEKSALMRFAEDESRDEREQARYLLIESLKIYGYLDNNKSEEFNDFNKLNQSILTLSVLIKRLYQKKEYHGAALWTEQGVKKLEKARDVIAFLIRKG